MFFRSRIEFNMVCLPCIVIPFFLFIWHKFLQPIVLRFWNPWGKVEDNPDTEESDKLLPEGDQAKEKAAVSNGASSSKVENGADLHSKTD
ncbi:hypothetical protein Ocin01_06087 [Orchesella cincta]|uniref:Uncharacterized protein n=1 Tax=Orchesella cincta TaxID=48709 RepID=A0A1D2N6K5_ORCCI|nr:hypothetical protein Ocin01_06087 [Orchesella cincta]